MAILRLSLSRIVLLLGLCWALSGCQTGYLIRSAASQAQILMARVPIDEALKDPKLSAEQKRKLKLAVQAHEFAQTTLGLKKNRNYTSYVQLDRPYVSYVVSASEKNELKHYLWNYPIVGSLPYKGFADKKRADEEAAELKSQNLDVVVRGVSAYSTLGWFNDPVLSSMLTYKDHELVGTIIHESVHATIYIKSKADFNERLAVFIGNLGTEKFYEATEGKDSPTLKIINAENEDEKLFSVFISREIKALEAWYNERKGSKIDEELRQKRLKEIQTHFEAELKPQLKTDSYIHFGTLELNNARLLNYKLYIQDLSVFERAFNKMGQNFPKFLDFCKSLESQKDPEGYLSSMDPGDGKGE
jgi:predicted aminopeptidase